MGHWVRLPGTQAHQSLATLRSGMENSEVEEEERHWDFPPTARTFKKDGTVPVASFLSPQIAARMLGKAVFLFLSFVHLSLSQ